MRCTQERACPHAGHRDGDLGGRRYKQELGAHRAPLWPWRCSLRWFFHEPHIRGPHPLRLPVTRHITCLLCLTLSSFSIIPFLLFPETKAMSTSLFPALSCEVIVVIPGLFLGDNDFTCFLFQVVVFCIVLIAYYDLKPFQKYTSVEINLYLHGCPTLLRGFQEQSLLNKNHCGYQLSLLGPYINNFFL